METQDNKRPGPLAAMLRACTLEEQNRFLQNVEKAQRTQARAAVLMQEIEALYRALSAGHIDRLSLHKAINRELLDADQPLIGRRLPFEGRSLAPAPPQPDGPSSTAPEELSHFLSNLSDADGKYSSIDELHSALQSQDREQLKRLIVERKSGFPPGMN